MDLIDKIRAEIERRIALIPSIHYSLAEADVNAQLEDILRSLISYLDTLQEPAKRRNKDCNDCKYNHLIRDQIGWQFRGCSGGDYKGKPIAEIELCPLKVAALQESEVDKQ